MVALQSKFITFWSKYKHHLNVNPLVRDGGLIMANSGIPWIDAVFDWCVILLYDVAAQLGITYEEINVWLFVIILPAVLLLSVTLNLYLVFLRYK